MWHGNDYNVNENSQGSSLVGFQPSFESNGHNSHQLLQDELKQFMGAVDQPEFGLYNNNTSIPGSPSGQYTPPPAQNTIPTHKSNLSEKAANLKAHIVEKLKVAKSATALSTVHASTLTQIEESSNSSRGSSDTPKRAASPEVAFNKSAGRSVLTEDDFHTLFSEMQPAEHDKVESRTISPIKSEPKAGKTNGSTRPNSSAQKAASNTFGMREMHNRSGDEDLSSWGPAKQTRNGSKYSDEDTIGEDPALNSISTRITNPNVFQSTRHRDPQLKPTPRHTEEQMLQRRYNDERPISPQKNGGQPKPSPRRSCSPATRQRDPHQARDERYDDVHEIQEEYAYESYNSNYRPERNPDFADRFYRRRESRDMAEDRGQQQVIFENTKEATLQKAKLPTLEDLLEIDEDLRDWLQLTDYHNVEKRTKTLNRRRALAALDAQRAKLLEEEEMETGVASKVVKHTSTVLGMAPPLVPVKAAATSVVAPTPAAVPITKIEQKPTLHPRDISPVNIQNDTGNKRSYSEFRDFRGGRDEDKYERGGRKDDARRVKSERDDDDDHPNSRVRESLRHHSITPPAKSYLWDEKETYVEGRGRGSGRGYNTERDRSPGIQPFKSGPPLRAIPDDSDENQGESKNSDRPFVSVGRYRGKAYDPNYHLKRGRGRATAGILTGPHHKSESRLPSYGQSGFGTRIADINPYRDPKGIDKGGRGNTRYFIVKSFNEANVVRCIGDSIWTTQVHNGEIFKHAFKTCKNVILIFSVNQSHAYQGYARMEGVPGSEHTPSWQNNLNWESAGAFKVRWITIAVTKFSRVGHLKNSLNENMAVLVAKDGQEVEEHCGSELVRLIDEEYEHARAD